MQHNFITIDNPSISAYTRVTDLTNPLGSGEPKYGNYNKILFSVKDGKYFMAIDRKVISE
jgi:hypothetical protein